KPAILVIGRQRGGIHKLVHNRILLLSERSTELRQHRVQGASLECIFRVADDGQLLSIVQRSMAPFATFRDKGHFHTAFPPEASDFANELIPCHGRQYRTYMTENQEDFCRTD